MSKETLSAAWDVLHERQAEWQARMREHTAKAVEMGAKLHPHTLDVIFVPFHLDSAPLHESYRTFMAAAGAYWGARDEYMRMKEEEA
jgi:hypothetical protein